MLSADLPHDGWEPRPYQDDLWSFLENGGKRAVAIWHRRSGKDELALHHAAIAAMTRVGTYWHLLPQQNQARLSMWEAVNPRTGRKRIEDAFPRKYIRRKLEQQMLIEFVNGSTWQLLGSDNYDALVGAPPVGVVFSEYALADPKAWALVRPILAENDGWALFISTPRGRNHLASLYQSARRSPDWFAQILPATDTGVFSPEKLEAERAEMIAENGEDIGGALFRQEYGCDIDAPVLGSYFAREIARLEQNGGVCPVPLDPTRLVITAWDIGYGDSTVIWVAQRSGLQVRILDCIEGAGVGAEWYMAEIARRGWYTHETILPHDAGSGSVQTGKSFAKTLAGLGAPRIRVLPQDDVDVGIAAVRRLLPSCVFDEKRCGERPLEALRSYRRHWDERNKVFRPVPKHDWTSHFADAFRYLALGLESGAGIGGIGGRKAPPETTHDPHAYA